MQRVLLIVLLLCCAGPVALANKEADQQFTFAVRLMQQGQSDLATDAFSDFLRDYAADRRASDARYYLAALARQAGDRKAASAHLEQITKPLFVSDSSISLLKGQLRLEAGDSRQAVTELEKVKPKDLPNDHTRSSWHYLLGVAYRKQDNAEAAAKQFDKATEADSPIRDRALLELGRARIALKQNAAATEALREAIKSARDGKVAAEARYLTAIIANQAKQFEKAIAQYEVIIEKHADTPWHKPAVVQLLRALYTTNKDAELIKQYEALAKHIPEGELGQTLYMRAASHARLKQYAKAIDWLTQFGQRTKPDHPQTAAAVYLAGICLYHTDPPAYEVWYLKNKPKGEELAYLRALAAIQRKQPTQAVKLLTPLIEPAKGAYASRALLQRAALYEQLKQPDKAAADYALFAQRYGDNAKAADLQHRAINLAFDAGKHDRVVELTPAWLAKTKNDKAKPYVQLRYSLSLVRTGKPDEAEKQLTQLAKLKEPASIVQLAKFYHGLLIATKVTPGSVERAQEAIALLEAALKDKLPAEQQVEAWAVLARLHRMTKQPDKALAAYQKLRELRPDGAFDPVTALWVGRGLYASRKFKAALPWLQGVIDQKQIKDNVRAQAMFFAAASQSELGEHEKAIEGYRKLLAFSKAFGDQGRLGLARALAKTGDVEAALEEYNGLINVQGTAVAGMALYESAMIHKGLSNKLASFDEAANHAEGEARKRLNRVVILYNHPQLDPMPLQAMIALGRLDASDGRRELAKSHFEKILKRKDRPEWHLLARAELQLLQGQRAEARVLLRKLLKEHANGLAAEDAKARLAALGD